MKGKERTTRQSVTRSSPEVYPEMAQYCAAVGCVRCRGECLAAATWRRERNRNPTFFANRVVWRNVLQALPLAADGTAGRLHSSLRGRR